ncbi:MAG: TIGR00730 family Rossman fold protein, partial [Bacteroidales bacterium]
MRKITVFCGSSSGTDELLHEKARELGHMLAVRGIGLLYGGTRIGIMGMLADSVLANGGVAEGVIPSVIEERKIAHTRLTRLMLVNTIEDRKKHLIEDGDAILAFPGSYGTLDELFNTLVLRQLGKMEKPVILLNLNGFYDFLIKQLDVMVSKGFMRAEYRSLL